MTLFRVTLRLTWFWVSESCESYITTDDQWASLSWNKAPIWAYDQIFITLRHLQFCWCGGGLSLTRGQVCRLQLLLVLASVVILVSESHGTCNHILLSQFRDFLFRHLLRLAGLRWGYSTLSLQTCFLSERPLIYHLGILGNVCWMFVYTDTCFVPSWSPRIYVFHFLIPGNVFHIHLVSKNRSLRKSVCQLVS
jgi:hypothetical protein